MRVLLLTPFEKPTNPLTRSEPKTHALLADHLARQHDLLVGSHVLPEVSFDDASLAVHKAAGGIEEKEVVAFEPESVLVAGVCGTGETYWGEYLGASAARHNYMWRARKEFLRDLISDGVGAVFLLDNVTASPCPWGATSDASLDSEFDLLGGVFQAGHQLDLELVELGRGTCSDCPEKPSHFYVSCHPQRMVVSEGIQGAFNAVDHILLRKALPLFAPGSGDGNAKYDREVLVGIPVGPSDESSKSFDPMDPSQWEVKATGRATVDLGFDLEMFTGDLALRGPQLRGFELGSPAWQREVEGLDPGALEWHRGGRFGFEPGVFVSGQKVGAGQTLFVSALTGSDGLARLSPDNLTWISGLIEGLSN